MKKYKKKPVIIEAEQWFKVTYDREAGHGIAPEDMPIYHLDVGYFRHPEISGTTICKHCGKTMHEHGWIDTLEGGHIVCPNDWIITGVKGEKYPCKPNIFEQTYEEVAETETQGATPSFNKDPDIMFNKSEGLQ